MHLENILLHCLCTPHTLLDFCSPDAYIGHSTNCSRVGRCSNSCSSWGDHGTRGWSRRLHQRGKQYSAQIQIEKNTFQEKEVELTTIKEEGGRRVPIYGCRTLPLTTRDKKIIVGFYNHWRIPPWSYNKRGVPLLLQVTRAIHLQVCTVWAEGPCNPPG